MENLNDLSNVQFELETPPNESAKPKNDAPPVIDFFNSAGNTKLSEDITDTPTEEITTDPNKPKGKIVLGKLISGKSAVTLVNIFIPSFIVFALNKFGYSANKTQLKLNAEEKEVLNPVVQDCLDYVEINFSNPFYALGFVAAMIYGSKIFDIVPDLKKIKADIMPDESDIEEIVRPNKPANEYMNYKPQPKEESNNEVSREFIDYKKRIESTSIRSEKNKIIIEALEMGQPKDLIEAYRIYAGIFPARNENYFRQWHSNNIEIFPDHLKFNNAPDEIL